MSWGGVLATGNVSASLRKRPSSILGPDSKFTTARVSGHSPVCSGVVADWLRVIRFARASLMDTATGELLAVTI